MAGSPAALPTLVLVDPRADVPPYQPLVGGEKEYPLAACVAQLQDELPAEARAGLIYSLTRVWPEASGKRAKTQWRDARLYAAYCQGHSIEKLAAAFGLKAQSVERVLRAARARAEDAARGADDQPSIEADGPLPPLEHWQFHPAPPKRVAERRADRERVARLDGLPTFGFALDWTAAKRIPAAPGRSAQVSVPWVDPPGYRTPTEDRARAAEQARAREQVGGLEPPGADDLEPGPALGEPSFRMVP